MSNYDHKNMISSKILLFDFRKFCFIFFIKIEMMKNVCKMKLSGIVYDGKLN